MKPTSFRLEQATLDDLETVRGWLQRRAAKRVTQADALAWSMDRIAAMLPEFERQAAEAKPAPAPPVEPQTTSAHALWDPRSPEHLAALHAMTAPRRPRK